LPDEVAGEEEADHEDAEPASLAPVLQAWAWFFTGFFRGVKVVCRI
tara:strand:- start:960 stop:1097 length:138 start_codon:yes stop_codon:yes gene_type:complete